MKACVVLALLLTGCSIKNHAIKLHCYCPAELRHLQEPDLAPPPAARD